MPIGVRLLKRLSTPVSNANNRGALTRNSHTYRRYKTRESRPVPISRRGVIKPAKSQVHTHATTCSTVIYSRNNIFSSTRNLRYCGCTYARRTYRNRCWQHEG